MLLCIALLLHPVEVQSIVINPAVCCLSVHEHISGTAGPIGTKFSVHCADPLWPWLGPPLAALRYVMYFRFYGLHHFWL